MQSNNQFPYSNNNQQQLWNTEKLISEVPPFPIGSLSPILRDTTTEMCNNTGFSEALIAAGILAGAGFAIQGRYDVSPAPGRRRPTSLFIVAVAGSGKGKTPTIEKIFLPFFEFDKELEKYYQSELSEFKANHKAWKIVEKVLTKELTNATNNEVSLQRMKEHAKQEPIPPKMRALTLSDFSEAGLFKELINNEKSIAGISAESDVILNGDIFKKPTSILKIWGNEPCSKTRHNTDHTNISERRLSLVLFIQPVKYIKFINGNGKDSHATGFQARTLTVFINDDPSPYTRRINYSEDKLKSLHAFIRKILEDTFSKDQEGKSRTCLNFTQEATEYWLKLEFKAKNACRPGGYFENHHEYAAKWPDNIARIAASLHVFDGATGNISKDVLERAEKIASWFADEFTGIFPQQQTYTALQQQANNLRDFIIAECQKISRKEIPYNHILQYGRGIPRDKMERDRTVEYLMQQRLVLVYTVGKTKYITPYTLP